jgi:hypothetical protein
LGTHALVPLIFLVALYDSIPVRSYEIFTLCCCSRGLLAAQRGLLVPRWNPSRQGNDQETRRHAQASEKAPVCWFTFRFRKKTGLSLNIREQYRGYELITSGQANWSEKVSDILLLGI